MLGASGPLLLSCLLASPPSYASGNGLESDLTNVVDLWAPPKTVTEASILLLERDSLGTPLRLRLSRDKQGSLIAARVPYDLDALRAISPSINVVTEEASEAEIENLVERGIIAPSSQSSSCPVVSSFSIIGDAQGRAIGGVDVHQTQKPTGAETQWVTFDFYTRNYRGSRSHMPIVLRHEDLLHGWGAFIGDNQASAMGCGPDSGFNSQIEGWMVYTPDEVEFPNFDPEDSSTFPPPGDRWQSKTYKSSCGSELVDGWIPVVPGVGLPRYRMAVQAASSKWAAYQIQEWIPGQGWEIVTAWTDMDTSAPELIDQQLKDWPFPPPNYNLNAQGIFVGATDSVTGVPNWEIRISNFQCGWF